MKVIILIVIKVKSQLGLLPTGTGQLGTGQLDRLLKKNILNV
jgi:hypothetical protein